MTFLCKSGGVALNFSYNTDTINNNNVLSLSIPANTVNNYCSSSNAWEPELTLSDIFNSEYYTGAIYDEKTNTMTVNSENGFTSVIDFY